jgi:hypothetical protein
MRFIRTLITKTARREELHVHFHQGPQGQAVPCFNRCCDAPDLSV